MADQAINSVDLHLGSIDDLFVDPDPNPLINPHLRVSGMQTVLNQLGSSNPDSLVHMNIFLPSDQITPELEGRVKDAIRRYCEFQVEQLETESAKVQYDGRRSLRTGFVGMAIFLILSVICYTIYNNVRNPVIGGFAGILATFFSVASWVIIWTPVDTVVYGWRPLRREANRYRIISNAQITIRTEPG